MDWTLLLGMIGGSAAVLGVAAIIFPGFGNFLGEIIAMFTRIIMLMYNSLPKPIKALFFIVLFFSFGVFMFNFTIGASYMCYENQDGVTKDVVYKVNPFEGISMQFWQVLKGEYISVTVLNHEDNTNSSLSCVNFDDFTGECLGGAQAFNAQVFDDNKEYKAMFAIAPVTTIASDFWFFDYSELDLLPPEQQWASLPDTKEQFKVYFVCYDKISETCTLKDGSKYAACDTFLLTDDAFNPWSKSVGTISYRYYENKEDDDTYAVEEYYVEARISAFFNSFTVRDGELTFIGSFAEGFANVVSWVLGDSAFIDVSSVYGMERCGYVSSEVGGLEFHQVRANVPTELIYVYKGINYTSIIYNAMYAPLMVSRDCAVRGGDSSNACTQVQGAPGTLFFDTQDASITAVKNSIRNNHPDDKLTYSRKKIVNIVCNEETDTNPFDTVMLFLGIEILNPKYMVFFVLIGSILSFFAFMSKFNK